MGLVIGTAGLGSPDVRCKGDAVHAYTVAKGGDNPKHTGPVRVVTCSRLITGHSEKGARSKRVRRGWTSTIPVAGRGVVTRRCHRLDPIGLKFLVCRPVARIHDAQRDALPVVPQGVGCGRVYRPELPCGIDRCARSRRIMAGKKTIFRRLPTGLRSRHVRWRCGDTAGVSRVRPLIRTGRRTDKDQ